MKNNQWEKDRKIYLESFPGRKCFQTFDDVDERKSKKLIYQQSVDGDQYPIDGDIDPSIDIIPVQVIIDLEKRNEYKAGVFFTINENKGDRRRSIDIVRVRSIFADLDEVDLPKSFEEQPSMIVESSPGKHHVYYFTVLDDDHYAVPLKSFGALQESIAKRWGGDPVVKDLPRVLRVPGFFHNKKEPFMSRIVDYTGIRFDFGLLVELFPPLPVEQWSAPKYQKNNFDPNGEYKGRYGDSKGGRNCGLAKIVGGMLKNNRDWGYIESECFKHNSYSHPPLSESEVRAVLKSCRRYS